MNIADEERPNWDAWRRKAPWRRAYALARGYFWLPCPLCGTHFGGHEARFGDDIPAPRDKAPSNRTMICPRCGWQRQQEQAKVCAVEGHQFSGIYHARELSHETVGRRHTKTMGLDLDGPASEYRCFRCNQLAERVPVGTEDT